MGNPWYRAWVGTVSDPKIAEAAVVADLPRCLIVAVWHAILESASETDEAGRFETTPRRVAAVLCEPAARIEAAFAAMADLGMIRDGAVAAWEKRQPARESAGDNAERQRRHRERRREEEGAGVTAGVTRNTMSHDVTRPESESETDLSSSSGVRESAREGPNIDLAAARPLGRDPFEAQARALLGDRPVAVDPDFGPVLRLLAEADVTRADVLAGLADAGGAAEFRPVSWRQCVGWVRRAAKSRIAAAARGQARGPPNRRAPKSSDLAVCLELALGKPDCDAPETFGADLRPALDGRAVAL